MKKSGKRFGRTKGLLTQFQQCTARGRAVRENLKRRTTVSALEVNGRGRGRSVDEHNARGGVAENRLCNIDPRHTRDKLEISEIDLVSGFQAEDISGVLHRVIEDQITATRGAKIDVVLRDGAELDGGRPVKSRAPRAVHVP